MEINDIELVELIIAIFRVIATIFVWLLVLSIPLASIKYLLSS